MKIISSFINNLWVALYRYLMESFFHFHWPIMKFIRKLYIYFDTKTTQLLQIFLIFNVIPRFVVLSIFLMDVFYFQELHYFYIGLSLLLLPFGLKLIEKIITQFYLDNYPDAESFLQINETAEQVIFEFAENKFPPDFIKTLDEFVYDYYIPLKNIPVLLYKWQQLQDVLFIPYMNKFLLAGYLTGGTYIFFFNC